MSHNDLKETAFCLAVEKGCRRVLHVYKGNTLFAEVYFSYKVTMSASKVLVLEYMFEDLMGRDVWFEYITPGR